MGCESGTEQRFNPNKISKFDEKSINDNFNQYVFGDHRIIDDIGNNYIQNDKIFQIIRKEEKDILFNSFYKSKKKEFQDSMLSYLKGQNLDFATTLTRQILINEKGKEVFDTKIKDEINDLKHKADFLRIKNLTIMILGVTGAGKSTLINSLLQLKGHKAAKVGRGRIVTTETTIYKSDKVPFLHLVDTRGIELEQEFSVNAIGINANDFIKNQLNKKDINEVVNCIWYCIKSDRFQSLEHGLVQDLMGTLGNYEKNTHIPVIMVLTQCHGIDHVNEMKKFLKGMKYEDVIAIMAQREKLVNQTYLESFGLDKLLQRTLLRCKEALSGDMRKIMIEDTTRCIQNKISKENEQKKIFMVKKFKLDTVDNDYGNKNIEDFICKIYKSNKMQFLGGYDMESDTYSLIKNSQFKSHRINFFSFCQNYENQIIENVLSIYAYKFLDIQATKEKEYKGSVETANKRNYIDFVNTTRKFLMDNFDYFSRKYYIHYIINKILDDISFKFQTELNNILKNLMYTNENQSKITQIFTVKYNEFEKTIFMPYSKNGINDFDFNYDDKLSQTNTDINSGFNTLMNFQN